MPENIIFSGDSKVPEGVSKIPHRRFLKFRGCEVTGGVNMTDSEIWAKNAVFGPNLRICHIETPVTSQPRNFRKTVCGVFETPSGPLESHEKKKFLGTPDLSKLAFKIVKNAVFSPFLAIFRPYSPY